MNKLELTHAISEKTGLKKKDAANAVEAFLSTVEETLISGDKVTLMGFGTFSVNERAARTGRNPQTGEAIEIKASKTPVFKVGKQFKKDLNA